MRVPDNRDFRAQRGALVKEMEDLVAFGGPKTPAQRARFEVLDREQKELRAQIANYETAMRSDTFSYRGGQIGGGEFAGGGAPEHREHREVFSRYLRVGANELSREERNLLHRPEYRDMGSAGEGAYPGATAGFFVPVGFVQKIEQAMKYFGPMLDGGPNMPTIMDTATGNPLPYPTANDTAVVGELVGENQITGSADATLGMAMFGAYKFSSKLVKVSVELLQDSAFDLESFLVTEFSRRIGRIVNTYFTTGTGSSQPLGIVPAAVAGGLIVAATGSATNTGGSETGGTSIGSDDLTALEHAVDPLYRPGAKYMMNDSTVKLLKKVKDKYGRPLWQESQRDGSPATINGYEYAINNDMAEVPTQASSPVVVAKTVLFGSMPKYTIRRVRSFSVLRLQERYAEYGQVAFLGWYRADGLLLDAGTHPIAAMTNTM